MTEDLTLSSPTSIEDAIAQRDTWVLKAFEFSKKADRLQKILAQFNITENGQIIDPSTLDLIKSRGTPMGIPEEAMYTGLKQYKEQIKIIENPVHLKIQCREQNGQLQIGYIRKQDGTELSYNDGNGKFLFHINVTVDLSDLTPDNRDLTGHIERS